MNLNLILFIPFLYPIFFTFYMYFKRGGNLFTHLKTQVLNFIGLFLIYIFMFSLFAVAIMFFSKGNKIYIPGYLVIFITFTLFYLAFQYVTFYLLRKKEEENLNKLVNA